MMTFIHRIHQPDHKEITFRLMTRSKMYQIRWSNRVVLLNMKPTKKTLGQNFKILQSTSTKIERRLREEAYKYTCSCNDNFNLMVNKITNRKDINELKKQEKNSDVKNKNGLPTC